MTRKSSTDPATRPARALAARLRQGRPQPALTGEIAACPCGEAVRAGLFLRNGDWEQAHRTAQALGDALGAHWHALVHRHEPDPENSRYWLRRVGRSPIYPRLAEAARAAGRGDLVAPQGSWDAERFSRCFADPAHDAWTRPLDALEQEALLEHCLALED